jgi:hypothetical protein
VGIDGGLSVELYMPVSTNRNSLSPNSGAQVFIYTNKAYVNSGKAQRVSLGSSTFIGVERTVSTNLPSPYSDCVLDTSSITGYDSWLFKYLVNAGYLYSKENCDNLYIQTQVIENCNCFATIVMNVNASARACTSIADLKCYTDTFQSLIRSNYNASIDDLCNFLIV